jgi:hypothetical protein
MTTNKKALCVGINQFKNYPAATLQGCVNDAKDISNVLQEYFGFTGGDITVLTDAQATKAAIMDNLKGMVEGAKGGKLSHLVFSISSRGTQVPDVERDEPGGVDDAFCPHDLAQAGNGWDRNHIIVEGELRDLFANLPPNVLLEVFLDTCHSGAGLKAIDMLLDRKPRFLPPPSFEAFSQIEGGTSKGLARQLLEKGIIRHVFWAGCRADQTSVDANIGGGWHGAFTYFFCKVMNACKGQLPRKDVLAKVRAELVANHYGQIPQLEVEATKRELYVGERVAELVHA